MSPATKTNKPTPVPSNPPAPPMPPRPPAPPPAPASAVKPPQQAQQRPANRPPVNQPPPPAASFDSLFIPAAEVKTLLRVVLYGLPGSSKTPTALSFPRPAVIDVESLARIYAKSFPAARFMPANSYAAVKTGILSVIANGGAGCETLVIDSLTPVYAERQMFYLEKFGYLDRPQWTRINTEMRELYRLLADCPVHTVVIGREANLYEETEVKNYRTGEIKKELKTVGVRMDLDKSAGYQPNIVIHMTGNGAGIVDKVQGVIMPKGTPVPNASWSAFFEPIAQSLATGDDPENIRDGVGKALFLAYWGGRGLKNSNIAEALGVKSSNDWQDGRTKADARIEAYGTERGWFRDEADDEPPADEQKPNPFGGHSVPDPNYTDFERNLIRALSPSPYKSDVEVMNAYARLVETGNIAPDWDAQQIVDYMFMVA